MTIDDLPTPALLLDLDVLEANLDRMARRSDALGVRLRPHVKTHKCIEVGRLQMERGARGITVSTLAEARTFATAGFRDQTWAFPFIPSRLEEARDLAEEVELGLLVDGPEAVDLLEDAEDSFRVWLKVDCGYGRAGVDPASSRLEVLSRRLASSDRVSFQGLLTHSGQAYGAASAGDLEATAEEERSVMVEAAAELRDAGIPVPRISVGSTPGMAGARSLEGVDEARPGNYVFYDYTQSVLGSCEVRDCALTVLATVVSSQPGADHCVVDAGALALSKDAGPKHGGRETMGEIFREYERGLLDPEHRLMALSQEHGVMAGRLPHGTRVRILPNHSCLTAACFDGYHVVRGREVVDRWLIHRER